MYVGTTWNGGFAREGVSVFLSSILVSIDFPANLFYLRINVERRCIKFPIYNVFRA